MRVAVFSAKSYDRGSLEAAAEAAGHELTFFEPRLAPETCVMARDFPAVCVFVNDQLSAKVVRALAEGGTRLIALRCAGFNNVDLAAAAAAGITVARVPAYSPHSVAEHTVGLMMALNRRLYKAYNRVRDGNFSLEGLLGHDLLGRPVGIVGSGKIGATVGRILTGFGCQLLFYDVAENETCRSLGSYVSLDQLLAESEIVTLHCPLVPATHHMIDDDAIERMRRGMMLINTSRGALVDTLAVIRGLKSAQIGHLGLDVYEEEADLFFEDLSSRVIQDDVFSRLLTFPNVLITAHQAFFTHEALSEIACVTLENITAFESGKPLQNEVTVDRMRK